MKSILNKVSRILPDKLYLSLLFYHHFHRWMDWKNPKTFNEKLQWLKLYDRKPEYTRMVDKYLVRDYIKEMIGEQYLIPLLGHYEKFDDIDFNQLPNQFVLKCNHGSHCSVICRDKDSFNKDEARKNFNRWLKKNYFWVYREYPYKNVQPCIVCEKFMSNNGGVPEDYKVFCFDGVPQLIRVDLGRFVDCTYNFCLLQRKLLYRLSFRPCCPNSAIRHGARQRRMQKSFQANCLRIFQRSPSRRMSSDRRGCLRRSICVGNRRCTCRDRAKARPSRRFL